MSRGHVSPCYNQVTLGSPPYGRHMDLMVGGVVEGIVYGDVDLVWPRPAEIVVSREMTKHNYYTRVGWLSGSFAGIAERRVSGQRGLSWGGGLFLEACNCPCVRTASPNEVTRNFLHRIVTLTYVTVILT